jgi:hypothetical protein
MGRPSKGPRLRLQKAKDRQRLWIIRDGQRCFGTGCAEGDRATAELKLAAYIAKHPDTQLDTTPLVGVYLLMRKGKVVYIGSSLNMPDRVADHRTNGRPFDQAVYIVTRANQRKRLEAILIRAIKPAQNKILPTRENATLAVIEAIHEDEPHADQ